jgi:hypothetical protein
MALKEVFARFGFAFDGKGQLANAAQGVDKLAGKAKGAESSIGAVAAGLASAFAGNAILGGINEFAAQLDTLDDLSAQTGVATDALQVYDYAAQKSGASAEEFNASLSLLQKGLGKTTEATGAQTEALKDLKIDTSKPRELADVLPEIIANFSKLPNSAKKAEVATSLFGRAGVRLLPTLERGAAGMADLRAELEQSGGIVSGDTIAKAGEYRDNLARVDRAVFALKGTLAGALFPQLSKVATIVSKAVGGLSDFAKGTTLAENAGLALAATLGGPLLSALGPFLKTGLKFAAIFAAVDDVIGFLNGKQSLIADVLDGAFGHGTATAVRNWANDAIGALSTFSSSADATMAALESDSTSTTTKVIAAFVGMTRDAVAGFPALRAGFSGTLDELYADLLAFVARGLEAWASFVGQIKVPPALQALAALIPAVVPWWPQGTPPQPPGARRRMPRRAPGTQRPRLARTRTTDTLRPRPRTMACAPTCSVRPQAGTPHGRCWSNARPWTGLSRPPGFRGWAIWAASRRARIA